MANHNARLSATTLVLLLTGASGLFLSTVGPDNPEEHLTTPSERDGDGERRWTQKKVDEDEDELFKDVDPRTLAAVLLEALNNSQAEKKMKNEEDQTKVERAEADPQVRTMEKGADRDRDGRHEIELLMAAQGKEQEKKEEEEKKKAQEEEERMTERVNSRTTSQKVQVQAQTSSPDARPQETTSPEQGGEAEEQLNPEELKNLETMMKEFPSLNAATEREGDQEHTQRESRGYSSYNEILPFNKGGEKKLKWQEETQKALSFPTFRGGNFMDDFEGGNDAQTPREQEKDEPKEDDEEETEEVLSPEEEEAQAKAEQEEMRRQAAEAQRAKLEEEKLADIASDMLLRYMVKQNNRKFGSTLSNAAEDKRSEEDQQDVEDEDIDPQTIDKLIEISSKLHLPADDVVDIISDVEKKKKKDLPPETLPYWRRPQAPDPSLSNGFLPPQTKQTSYQLPKPPSSSVQLLKSWFQDKSPMKSQERWSHSPLGPNVRPKQKSVYQEPWLKSSGWRSYPRYPYPYFYQRKYNPVYYPVYYPSSPRPYYFPSIDQGTNPFPPRRRYQGWVQPRLRQPPPSVPQNPYYASFPFSLYPRRIQPLPKPHSPALLPALSSQKKPFYYSAPAATQSKDYYEAGAKPDASHRDNLDKYIQQILMTRPRH